MQFVLFTDNIKDLSIRDTCRAARKAGFDGLHLIEQSAADLALIRQLVAQP